MCQICTGVVTSGQSHLDVTCECEHRWTMNVLNLHVWLLHVSLECRASIDEWWLSWTCMSDSYMSLLSVSLTCLSWVSLWHVSLETCLSWVSLWHVSLECLSCECLSYMSLLSVTITCLSYMSLLRMCMKYMSKCTWKKYIPFFRPALVRRVVSEMQPSRSLGIVYWL